MGGPVIAAAVFTLAGVLAFATPVKNDGDAALNLVLAVGCWVVAGLCAGGVIGAT